MTGPLGNSEFCFPRISMFPSTSSRETLRFSLNKIHCSPRDQSLSDLLYSKTKQKQNLKTAMRFQPSRATAVNISRVTVNCFPFDVIVFAMLPAHGIWRETVSLLDVMWPWTSQWMGALWREKRQLYNNCGCYMMLSRLTRFEQQRCARACALARFSIPKMKQHIASGWPNAHSMLLPTISRCFAFKCYDGLAGACKR